MFDLHRVSRHIPEPESISIMEEIRLGRRFVDRLARAFPEMCVTPGNHDARGFKQAKEKGIPEMMLRPIWEVFNCPNWSWEPRIVRNGVYYFHGDGYSGPNGTMKAAMTNRMSTVMGHLHPHGGVQYQNNGNSVIFALNAGCLIDTKSLAFRYGSTSQNKPTLGCGVVLNRKEAHFIPL